MSNLVYTACALTSVLCAVLLTRGYRRSHHPLLFWSSMCFVGLAIGNIMLVVDLVLTPDTVDLSLGRNAPTLVGLAFLIYRLVWEAK